MVFRQSLPQSSTGQADPNAEEFAGAFQPRRGINCVTMGCVVHHGAAKVTHRNLAGIDADPRFVQWNSFGFLLDGIRARPGIHFHGAVIGALLMVWLIQWRQERIEVKHRGVADNLVQIATVLQTNLHHVVDIVVQQGHRDFGVRISQRSS